MWFLEQLCCDIDNYVMTMFLIQLLQIGVVDVCCCDPVFISQQDFSVFSLYLCHNPICYVATRPLFHVLESLSRHRKVCLDIETSLQLEVCLNIGFFYCDQVSSLSKHHMSRPCFSVATSVSSSFSVTTCITL